MPLPEGLCPVVKDPNLLPQILLCFKSKHKSKKTEKAAAKDEPKKTNSKKRSKSRELRMGILYVGCDCERRNGLQDQCPRTGCQGSPECVTSPPTCLPSEFSLGKHLIAYFEAIIEARAEFRRQMSEKYGAGKFPSKEQEKEKEEDLDYECFPLDKIIQSGMPCPICNKPIEGCFGDHVSELNKKDNVPAPFTVDLTTGCLCCPAAC